MKKITMTKFLIFFLFLNCTIIELFTGWVTVKSLEITQLTGAQTDFTPLITLIGSAVSEVIGFAIYALKSIKENTIGGIVYDNAINEIKQEEGKG